ncbi:MAG: OsmC family protein [Candidatus Krumholzibacteria bacterium]|nr:OsmC family protein [Candidatus Krumholzibacteria bacterium]
MEIEVKYAGGRKVEASVKGYHIVTDQPMKSGGEGSAPAPFDLFLASIATCAGYYVFDFCLQRKIPVDGVRLLMHTEKDKATKMLTRISIQIQLPKNFPDKYEKAVVRAVDLCAVKKHLIEPPAMKTFVERL